MKRLVVALCCVLLLVIPKFGQAAAINDYEEALTLHIAAGVSVATYNNRIGELANHYLKEDGWEIDRYTQNQGIDGARFLLAQKEVTAGTWHYILAFVGTETIGDVGFDLKVDKVYFAGNSIESFKANYEKTGVPNREPKVHRGFYEFVQSGLTAKTMGSSGSPLFLTDVLLEHKDYKIYLVGHSLGGAAATLMGAAMLEVGIKPEQIEVITFGAPPVGNSAFANKFDPILNLTRVVISGDPITGILQTLVGGYKQFGKEVRWELPAYRDQTHNITEYMDLVLKNYYDIRQQVLQAGIQLPKKARANDTRGEKVYIAPLKNNLPQELSGEFRYMKEGLWGEYRQSLPGCTVAKESETDDWRETAISKGYKWVVVPEMAVTRLKQEQNQYYITMNQTVYEAATGSIIEVKSFSASTYNLTPLEAFLHSLKRMNTEEDAWMMHVK